MTTKNHNKDTKKCDSNGHLHVGKITLTSTTKHINEHKGQIV